MAKTIIDIAGIAPDLGFVVGEALPNDGTGVSVAGAGDINGDGFDDIVLGAPGVTDGEYLAGTVYVIFGVAGATRGSIDLATLSANDGFAIAGTHVRGYLGGSVASAGDVNGDGYDDLIIGESGNPDGGVRAGGAYVIFGGPADALTGIDLADLAGRGFFIQGNAEFDYAGAPVSSAGDVNGDGYDDLLVGARQGDVAGDNAGEAYVIFGKAGLERADIDLSSLAAQDGFVILGDAPGDRAGASLAAAGDINGDGYDDILVGAPSGDDGGPYAGEAYVIFGKAGATRDDVYLSALADDGFIVQGPASLRQAGTGVSSVGDINGDGIDDFAVGAPYGEFGSLWSGAAYVIFGQQGATRSGIDLANFGPGDGFVITGDNSYDMLGFTVQGAGDVNGDGYDDLIVSAPYNDEGGNRAGKSYVIFGKAGATRGDLDLGQLTSSDGLELKSNAEFDSLGRSLGSGDFNGDGFADVLVGAPFGASGEVYVLFGSSVFVASSAPVAGDDVLRALVDTPITFLAAQLLGNDFDDNGDPLEIVSIENALHGAATINPDGSIGFVPDPGFTGTASFDYVVSDGALIDTGHVDIRVSATVAARTIALDGLGDDGFVIEGKRIGDLVGWSVSPAGDVNGDGRADAIIGSQASDGSGLLIGEAYVIFGKDGATREDIELSAIPAGEGFTIRGEAGGHNLTGFSVSTAGDVDGDGIDDLIVGTGNAEKAYVVFGREGADRTDIDLSDFSSAEGFTIASGSSLTNRTGRSVSDAGDINGDGYGDVVVGASFGSSGGSFSGEAYVLFGKPGAQLGDVDLSSLTAGQGFLIQGAMPDDQSGFSVSAAGDVNGDGIDDMILGAPVSDSVRGTSYVIFGKSGASRATIELASLGDTDGFAIKGSAAGDYSGSSVSSAGDVNGDGYADLVISAFPAGIGGRAYVIYGKPGATRDDIDLSSLANEDGFIVHGGKSGDFLGFSVSAAGDFDGDGFDDLIIGAMGSDAGGLDAGGAYIIYGAAGDTREDIDLSSLSAGDGLFIRGGEPNNRAGYSVSSAGDINGDGFADVLVGEPFGAGVGDSAGQAYVVFGRPRLPPEVANPLPDRTLTGGEDFQLDVPADTFVDPDLDPLLLGATLADGSPLPEWLTFDRPTASFSGTPPAGIFASFEISLSASDGSHSVSDIFTVTVVPQVDWRLFTSDGYAGEIGGSGQVFGTAGFQDIAVLNEMGAISFDPSFNKGGDIVRLPGNAGDWQVVRSGSAAVFSDGDTYVQIPVGTAGMAIVFDDGVRSLRFDAGAGSMKIGAQGFGATSVQIIAPADGSPLPTGAEEDAPARLFLGQDKSASAGGHLQVFGTSGAEQFTVTGGAVSLDPSFNKGGDTLVLGDAAADFLASRSGSTVLLDGAATDLVIPVGTAGMTISFPGDDERTLLFDAMLNNPVIGTQEIDTTPTALIAFG